MNIFTVTLENKYMPLRGKGVGLYIVAFVDQEDAEDTAIELWRGDDEDDVRTQFYDSRGIPLDDIGDEDEDSDENYQSEFDPQTVVIKFVGGIS